MWLLPLRIHRTAVHLQRPRHKLIANQQERMQSYWTAMMTSQWQKNQLRKLPLLQHNKLTSNNEADIFRSLWNLRGTLKEREQCNANTSLCMYTHAPDGLELATCDIVCALICINTLFLVSRYTCYLICVGHCYRYLPFFGTDFDCIYLTILYICSFDNHS